MTKKITVVLPRLNKILLAAAGGAVMVLQNYYGQDHWFQAVIAALAVMGVGFAENHTGGTTPPPQV